MSCSTGSRLSLDPPLMWLWCRPAATALIQALAWEPPCAVGAALKNYRGKEKKREREKERTQKENPAKTRKPTNLT